MKRLILIGILVLSGCDQANDLLGGPPVPIPPVSVACTSSSNPNCQSGGFSCSGGSNNFQVVVYMTRSGCSLESSSFSPLITGNASLVCNGTGCTATVNSWTDATTFNTASEIPSGVTDICGRVLIDCDGNGTSSGDLESEEEIDIDEDVLGINLNIWSDV